MWEMNLRNHDQIQNNTVSISVLANAHGKGMNPSLLPPLIKNRLGSLVSRETGQGKTCWGEGKLIKKENLNQGVWG